jgi:hypothetical protein
MLMGEEKRGGEEGKGQGGRRQSRTKNKGKGGKRYSQPCLWLVRRSKVEIQVEFKKKRSAKKELRMASTRQSSLF